MTDETIRFQTLAAQGDDPGSALTLAKAVRTGDDQAARDLAALWLHAAVAAPERLAAIYDASAEGWLGIAPRAPLVELAGEPAPIAPEFWGAFWTLVRTSNEVPDPAGVTQRTAALAGMVGPEIQTKIARIAMVYPGVREAAAQGYPERFTLEALARAPKGSLGAAFHDLIVDNGFDLEVLDRETLGVADMEPPLDYLNARILQCHDLWHLLAGYRTTGLHEIAISGFQAAQFGHHYSSMFLAMVLAKSAFGQPLGIGLMLDVILSAWTHGRQSPSLMPLDWPAIWHDDVDMLRSNLGISAYASPYPADLFEQLRAA